MIKSLAIFGTGSAGWITALYIRNRLPDVALTILNPKKHQKIGVGESTQPQLVGFIKEMGFDLNEFMQATDASLKHGIYYPEWLRKGSEYWHPFSNISTGKLFTDAHYYQQLIQERVGQTHQTYYRDVHPSYDYCVKQGLSTREMPFALHIDADLMCDYFRSKLEQDPMVTIVDFDTYAVKPNAGKIGHVVVDGNNITADLWIDCSGFSRVLISQVSDCATDGYQGRVNRALFGRVQYEEGVEQLPYTRAHAHSAGWCWTTPLASKVGTGWLWHSDYQTEQQARQQFGEYWQGRVDSTAARMIEFSSESLLEPWSKNVVAIGLSSGFVEPLEATGIAWFQTAGDLLTKCLQHRHWDHTVRNSYNSVMRVYIEDIQDFIDAHYMFTQRDEPYWTAQAHQTVSQRLHSRIENYSMFLPNKTNRSPTALAWAFNDVSWIDILTGYEFEYAPLNLPDYSGWRSGRVFSNS